MKFTQSLLYRYPEHTLYVSVFGGSGSDILAKEPSKIECFNDIDSNVVSMFRALRNRQLLADLKARLWATPYSRTQYGLCCRMLQSDKTLTPVTRAWAWFVASWQGMTYKTPMTATETNWSNAKSDSRNIRLWRRRIAAIEVAAERFRWVHLENRSWEEMFKQYDLTTTLFYCDPPYVISTMSNKSNLPYKHMLSDDDHIRLLDTINKCKGMVILFGFDCDLYQERLQGWTKIEADEKNKTHREFCWVNFAL